MLRTAAVYSLPALLVMVSWLRLEEPRQGRATVLALLLLALAPALLPSLRLRLVTAAPAALFAAWLAFGRPNGGEQGFFRAVWERFADGFYGFYDTRVPFTALELPAMHGVVLVAAFGFCLALALAIASRLVLPAMLVLLAGAAWPATLLPQGGVAFGAVVLAAALWILGGMRAEAPTPALATGVLVVLFGAAAATSSAVAKDAVLDWQKWQPTSRPSGPVSVSYVWDANYAGIDFPKEKTTVLRIRSSARRLYWRATTLDRFTADRWIQDLFVRSVEPATGTLPDDPLLPREVRREEARVTQEVQVVALRDARLVAAPTPVSIDGQGLGRVTKLSNGVVRLNRSLRRGDRYTVDSYAPRPQPAQLAEIKADYPPQLDRYFDVEQTRMPRFGSGRQDEVDAMFAGDRFQRLLPYEGLYREARRLAEGARAPYGAVVAIEAWLRRSGEFVYDEQPAPAAGAPPLAHFVEEGRRGYCQQFAGAMALMLRFLGVPARVAAGFTSGTYRDGVWTVTDHNAHTWVEVWFPRWGWVSFDPTPGRGELAGHSASSPVFNAGDAAQAFDRPTTRGGRDPGGAGVLAAIEAQERGTAGARSPISREQGLGVFWTLLGLVVLTGGAIGGGKLLWRRARYWRRDPRGIAAAARRELAEFLVDQGVPVDASATPEELRQLVRAQLGLDASHFAEAVAAARFGPPGGSAGAAAAARRELRSLLRLIRRSVGRPQRLRGFVALRSLRS
jgi:protein-glutamine gamma-glutamyltransferase